MQGMCPALYGVKPGLRQMGPIVLKAKAVRAKTKLRSPCQNENSVSISCGKLEVN